MQKGRNNGGRKEALANCFLRIHRCIAEFFSPAPGINSAVGQVHGTINGVMLPKFVILAAIKETQDNSTRVVSQVTGLPGPIRNWLQAAVPLTAPIYWAVASETSGAKNGMSLTNGNFIYKTQMKFDTGETLTMEHRALGVNSDGALAMRIGVAGKTPMFPANSTVKRGNSREEFVRTGAREVKSVTRGVLEVNGVQVSYWSNSTVTFAARADGNATLAQVLEMKEVRDSSGVGQGSLGFGVEAVMDRGEFDWEGVVSSTSNRQTARQTARQTDRQTDRQTHRAPDQCWTRPLRSALCLNVKLAYRSVC